MAIVYAKDGLRARDNGEWAKQKLAFLEDFVPPALQATQRKLTRVYLDLFAGPGRNVGRETGEEFDGSPLRSLRMHAPNNPETTFTHAAFVNYSKRDHAALQARVAAALQDGRSRLPVGRVMPEQGDANALIPQLLTRIDQRAYVFVFADIEAPRQWPWASVEALKAQGHESVDLYMLFPLDMAIQRLICYEREHSARYAALLTRFFGTDAWREFAERRRHRGHAPQLRVDLEALYLRQLRTRWDHAGSVQVVKRRGEHYLYRMLFATSHDAGRKIASWAQGQSAPEQMGFL